MPACENQLSSYQKPLNETKFPESVPGTKKLNYMYMYMYVIKF